jgi:hypothetical protein
LNENNALAAGCSSFLPPNSPPTAGFHSVDPLPNRFFEVAAFSSVGFIVLRPPNNGFGCSPSAGLAPKRPPFGGAVNENFGMSLPNKLPLGFSGSVVSLTSFTSFTSFATCCSLFSFSS